MSGLKSFIVEAGLVAAATIGAGMFALPYVFAAAGWLTGFFYLLILGAIIIGVHILYWEVLEKTGGRGGLLGLASFYLGKGGYYLGLVAVLVGLLLTLAVYLILGSQFLNIIFPALGSSLALIVFWFVSALPLFFKEKRILALEGLGVALVAAIILFIFFNALPNLAIKNIAVNLNSLILPLGPLLFAMAGWTAIEPLYALKRVSRRATRVAIGCGTILAAALYFVFAISILSSAGRITPDTISGLTNWPVYKIIFLAALGMFAVWTSHLPIGLEVKNAFVSDLKLKSATSLVLVAFLPLVLVALGFNSFLTVIGLAGGLFLSLQYLLIIMVAKKVLRLGGFKNLLLNLAVLVFVLAAVYEVYYFIVK